MVSRPAPPGPDTAVDLWEITLGDLLREAAADAPEVVALVSAADGRRWTYAELDAAVDRVAPAIAVLLAPGDRLAIWSTGLPEYVLLQFAAARAGVVLVPLNPAYQAPELSYALGQSGARAVFVGPDVRDRSPRAVVDGIRAGLPALEHVLDLADLAAFAARHAAADLPADLPAVTPDAPVMIQYTSGTTGVPKGALLTHRGIVNNARFSALRAGIAAGGVWLNPLPLFHTGGCVFNALGSMANRGTHVLMPAWDAGSALELIERERVTFLCCVPTMLIGMMEHPDFPKRDLSGLRTVLSGGSTVPPELVRRIEAELGVTFVMVFGLTEAGPTVTMTAPGDPGDRKATTVGFPLPHTEVTIVDPLTGSPVAVDEPGEVWVRGYGRMLGYFEKPDETAAATGDGGWVRTGDLGRRDAHGYLRITGRLKEIIRRGGMTVAPRAVEDVLFGRPGVGDVAVVGIPDERLGERVAAFLRSAPGAELDLAALQAVACTEMARFKVPEFWVVVAELPTTPSGKVQKFVLRDRFLAGAYADSTTSGDMR